jgi:D-xylose reductase
MDMLSYCRIPPSVLQIEVHPYLTQQALLNYCQQNNIRVTAFSPLGSGSYIELGMDGGLGRGVLEEPSIKSISDSLGKSPAQVVLRWGIQRCVSSRSKNRHLTFFNYKGMFCYS